MFEIKDQSDTQATNLEIIDHLGFFDIADFLNGFGVDNDFVKDDQVGYILSHIH
ncbi:hypothetical protein Selin_0685 [Desulfurispirillum indicum S5]|uniref:Uncharacterized protein n=1 Tax=Desulfurispirillum indicum (strain ATCC BAA-1389 / DSM 22839 / S5) TaxID=653733 RepID=E6W1H4_DESIS|nr:hypothetical protein Selin_0685 [Desulfurispirillum indicum S5]